MDFPPSRRPSADDLSLGIPQGTTEAAAPADSVTARAERWGLELQGGRERGRAYRSCGYGRRSSIALERILPLAPQVKSGERITGRTSSLSNSGARVRGRNGGTRRRAPPDSGLGALLHDHHLLGQKLVHRVEAVEVDAAGDLVVLVVHPIPHHRVVPARGHVLVDQRPDEAPGDVVDA